MNEVGQNMNSSAPEGIARGRLLPGIMNMPARQRLDALLEHEDAEALVARLSVHDFYFTVKEIGAEDAMPLVALAKVEQLNHLFGLEWWVRDRVQPAKALEWLRLLDKAGGDRLLRWFYHADFELLVTLFKKWVQVALAPEDVDPVEARDMLPRNTIDDQYYWEPVYPQYEDLIERMLSLLFEVHSGFYRELLNHVMGAGDAQMEEDAYRFNKGRLEDEGIPDFHDAVGIYQMVDEGALVPTQKAGLPAREDGSLPPLFAVALLPPADLLGAVLRKVDDVHLVDSLQVELAALANKVIIADGTSMDSPGATGLAMDKVSAYVSLGLQVAGAGDVEVGAQVLRDVYLERLFQLGYTKVARLRNRFRRLLRHGWLSRWPTGIGCLDLEWAEPGELLLAKTPQIMRNAPGPDTGGTHPDHFRSLEDLRRGEEWVEMISALGLVYGALDPQPDRLVQSLWPRGVVGSLEDVTMGVMVWTACANSILARGWEVSPIPRHEWQLLFPKAAPASLRESLHAWIDEHAPSPLDRSRIEAYLQPIFSAYEEEVSGFLEEGRLPDPEMVRFFLFAREEQGLFSKRQ